MKLKTDTVDVIDSHKVNHGSQVAPECIGILAQIVQQAQQATAAGQADFARERSGKFSGAEQVAIEKLLGFVCAPHMREKHRAADCRHGENPFPDPRLPAGGRLWETGEDGSGKIYGKIINSQ